MTVTIETVAVIVVVRAIYLILVHPDICSQIGRKLAQAGADIEIKSIYGFGYKLVKP